MNVTHDIIRDSPGVAKVFPLLYLGISPFILIISIYVSFTL